MRLTTVILIASLLQVSAATFGQRITINQNDAPLTSIFKEIRKQSGYDFYYNSKDIPKTQKVDIAVTNATLEEALKIVLKGSALNYEIDGKIITIKKVEAPFIDRLAARFQAIDVKGKVVDSLGNGLAGATVSVKGLKQSTQTTANGDFYLKNVDEGAVLMVSYLGYVTKEQIVSKDFNRVQLHLSTSKLDEVQIQAYGKTSRRLSTGNIVTIKAEELAKQPVTNPLMALQARVPNLVITPASGQPNGIVNIQLRGQNSLSTSSQRSEPLIIIDGVPYQNTTRIGASGLTITADQISALSLINVNDIEQIDVLADADATSIYGSRGGNGVILITTKKGKRGPVSVNLAMSTGINQVARKLDMMNTDQYLTMRMQAYQNDGLLVPDRSSTTKNANNYDLTLWDSNRYTDWQEEFLGRNAASYATNVSIQGGTPTVQYLIGGNYARQGYVYPGEAKYENGVTNLNVSGNSNDGKFKAQLSNAVTFNHASTPGSDFARLVGLAPNAPSIYDKDGSLNWEPDVSFPGSVKPSTWTNPYAQLLRTSDLDILGLRGSADVSYQFLNNLSVKITTGYTLNHSKSLALYPIASQDPATNPLGYAFHANSKNESFTFDPQILYNLLLGKNKFEALFGVSYQAQDQLFDQTSAEGYTSDALLKSIGAAGIIGASNSSNEYRYIAGFGRLNYNYDNKYILNLSGRRDGSSRFGPGYQFGNFWSAGGAWIFSEEKLLKKIAKFLSYGKLRASYGTTGNDGVGDYQYLELYSPPSAIESIYTYQGVTPIFSSGAFNSDYHWESIKKLETELTTGFFNDRITLTSAYWRTRGYDQLGRFPLPATAGASTVVRNQTAVIQNSGWDFFLDTKNIDQRDLKWTTGINFGLANNKIVSMPTGTYDGYSLNRLAMPGDQFSGYVLTYKYRGVNVGNGLYQFDDAGGVATTVGDNGGAATQAAKIDTRPLTMGITNNFKYKGLSFSFFVQLTRQMGRNFLFDRAFTMYNPGSFSSSPEYGNLPVAYNDAWKHPGQEVSLQRLTSTPFGAPVRSQRDYVIISDAAWVDASFIKLRNVSLSYNFPEKWITKVHLKGLSVYLTGQNLLTITKYQGLDPETQSASVLPLMRVWNGGIQINL